MYTKLQYTPGNKKRLNMHESHNVYNIQLLLEERLY